MGFLTDIPNQVNYKFNNVNSILVYFSSSLISHKIFPLLFLPIS